MDSEDAIYHSFAHGGLKYIDVVERLQSLGHDPKEAERIASEWADGLEARANNLHE